MRVVLLTNFIPPYRLPLFAALRGLVDDLRILVSTPMERDRAWNAGWGDLPVIVQRSFSFRRRHLHPNGFTEFSETHIPFDTPGQLRRYRPDVIISGELGARTILAVLYRSLNPQCRLIIWATLSERTERARRNRYIRVLRGALLRRADAVLVNGASGRRYVEGLGALPHRIVEMPYSMDLGNFSPPPKRREISARRLLLVGQLIERKGILPWLDAVESWASAHSDQSLEIRIAGHGPLEQAIRERRLPENIELHLLGTVDYGALSRIYGECGIFVLPTLADEWGIVVNEAMASGLPVLGSIQAQAVEELVEDGRNGWLFDADSHVSALAALTRALSTSPADLDAMSEAAQQTIFTITPDAMAHRIRAACDLCFSPHGKVTDPVVTNVRSSTHEAR